MTNDGRKKNTILGVSILAAVAVLAGCLYARSEYIRKDKEQCLAALTDSLSMVINEEVGPLEYGSAFDQSVLVKECNGDLKTEGTVDTAKTGPQTITYTVSGTDPKYGQYAEKKYTATVEIVDTQVPVIELEKENLTVTVGTPLNVMPNIKAVTDPVDGTLPEGDGVKASYTAVSDLNTDKKGTYTVTVTAADANGNQTTRDFSVTVKPKPTPTPTPVSVTASAAASSTTGSTVKVSVGANYSAVYNYLTGTLGYSRAAACGICANIVRESNFNPRCSSSIYYGLCQWGGGRKSNMFYWCRKNGYDPDSVVGQLQFMHYELKTGHPSVYNVVRNVPNTADGAAEAAEVFCRRYERAAKVGKRPDIARAYFNK